MHDVLYALEQGIENPRTEELNWTHYEWYDSLAVAKAEAKKHKGNWRICETRCVWQSGL